MNAVRYQAHHVVLDPGRWKVQVGPQVLTPEPKVFELLSYLMRHSGRVVSKAELLDSLWSGDVVGESVLTRCVSCARKLLADDSKTPRFIRTLHGRGYEFIAPVSTLASPVEERPQEAAAVPGAVLVPIARAAERSFVGRQAELARLRQTLSQLEARRGDFVLLSGEPGIGKTRLLEEVVAAAPPALDVHVARCSSLEGAPALLMWRDCLRSLIRSRSIKVVRRAFEDAPSGARKLLLGTDRWQAEDRLGWDSPADRFRTFDAIARGLAELASQRPLALLFDDLHAADLVSLLLLEFVISSTTAPILLLGATRDVEPQGDPARAEALARLRGACRNELGLSGLRLEEVRQLVEQRGGSSSQEQAALLLRRTGGNPFFLSVLTQGASENALPSAVQKAVSQRLATLDADCVSLLEMAAICGQSFEPLLLARAAQLPFGTCEALLATACAARVVTLVAPNEYRFNHDLIREVLASQLSAEQRPLVHRALAHAMDSMPSFHDARHAATLAHHFVAAAHEGCATRALDLSIRAGAYALRNLAYEEAVEHFNRAYGLLSLNERDQATECALLLDLGLSQISAGQREAGQNTLRTAAELARELGSASDLATVALSLSPGLFAIETGVYDPALVGLLREALQLTGHGDPKRRALLLARLALALYWADTFAERADVCHEAAELAEQIGTDEVRAEVWTARIFSLLRPDNLTERQELSEQALEVCRRAGNHQGLLMNRMLRSAMWLEVGDRAAARFEQDSFRQLAEATNQPQSLWIVNAQRARDLLLDGRLREVEQLAGACLLSGQRVRDHNALLTFGVHLTFVRIEQGRAAEVLDVIRDYSLRYPRILGWRVMYCYALGRAGRQSECRAEYESFKRGAFAVPPDLNWLPTLSWLAELCHALGDADSAPGLYQRLAPYAGRMLVLGYAGIVCLGSVERCLALLAATAGNPEAARQHFDAAIAANRRIDAVLPLVQSLCDYADWLRAQGSSAAARPLTDEADALIAERDLLALAAQLAAHRAAEASP